MPNKRMRLWWVAAVVIVLLGLLGGLFVFTGKGGGSVPAPPTTTAQHAPFARSLAEGANYIYEGRGFGYQTMWVSGYGNVKAAVNNGVQISAQYQKGSGMYRTWKYAGWTWTHASFNWYRDASGRVVCRDSGWVPNSYSVVSSPFVPYAVWHGAQVAWGNGGTAVATPAPSTSTRSEPHGALRGPAYAFGNCTMWAFETAHNAMYNLGNANTWNERAAAQGYRVVSYPVKGSTAVFEAGVQGASAQYGHVGHVIAVNGSSFQISEMNVYGVPGGGFNKVDYRWVHSGPGVSFILPK